jgi:nitroreductase
MVEDPSGTYTPKDPNGFYDTPMTFAETTFESHGNPALFIIQAALRIRDPKISQVVRNDPSLFNLWQSSQYWFNQEVQKAFLDRRKLFYDSTYREISGSGDNNFWAKFRRNRQQASKGKERETETAEEAPSSQASVADTEEVIILDRDQNVLAPGPNGEPDEDIQEILAAFQASPSAGRSRHKKGSQSVLTADDLEEMMMYKIAEGYEAKIIIATDEETQQELRKILQKNPRGIRLDSTNHPKLQDLVFRPGAVYHDAGPGRLFSSSEHGSGPSQAKSVKSGPGGSDWARSEAGAAEADAGDLKTQWRRKVIASNQNLKKPKLVSEVAGEEVVERDKDIFD